MDSKILPLNVIPDHPRFLRLPSLSRSLVHSILPKACQAMHNKPLIFSVSPCSISLPGPPKLSERTRKKHKSINTPIQKSYNARPFSPSYTYKKMFIQKPSTPLPQFKYARLKKKSENKEQLYVYIKIITLFQNEFDSIEKLYSELNDNKYPKNKFIECLKSLKHEVLESIKKKQKEFNC